MKKQARVFTISEQFRSILTASSAFVLLREAKKYKRFNKQFKERIMLAITEVNGCQLCSYVHTKVALSSGMSQEDIVRLLTGDTSDIPLEQAVGVLFAQYFSSSFETPSEEAMKRLLDEYGPYKSELIVAACHMITMTNGMGISMHHLLERLKFHKVKGSKRRYEVLNPLMTMILFPTLVIIKKIIKWFGVKPRLIPQN